MLTLRKRNLSIATLIILLLSTCFSYAETPICLVEPTYGGFKPREGSAYGNTWSKSEVVPVVFVSSAKIWQKEAVTPACIVEPTYGGFKPVIGNAYGNTWPKDKVVPVCLVEKGYGGFVPTVGSSYGNSWSSDNVRVLSSVEPTYGGFKSR